MSTEKYKYYHIYEGPKIKYTTYSCRCKRGKPFEEAIKPLPSKSKNINKLFIGYYKRECSVCHKTKIWEDFTLNKNRLNGHGSRCKICANEATKKYRSKIETREKTRERQKQYREGVGKDITLLNTIFYRDKQIQKNIKILGENRKKEDIKIDKFYYFLNKGYDKKELMCIYKLKEYDIKLSFSKEY